MCVQNLVLRGYSSPLLVLFWFSFIDLQFIFAVVAFFFLFLGVYVPGVERCGLHACICGEK